MESVNDAELLLAVGVSKIDIPSFLLVNVINVGGGEWVTIGEVEQVVGSLLGLVLLHL